MNGRTATRRGIEDVFRLISSGQFQQAEQQCVSLLEKDPDDVNVLGLLGAVSLRLGKTTEAKPVLEKAIAIEPGFAKPHEDLGMLCLHEGHLEQAVNSFEEAIRLDGTQPGAWAGLAEAQARLGNIDAANKARQHHLELSPVAQALDEVRQLVAEGDLEAAEQVCDKTLKSNPDSIPVLRQLAMLASSGGRHSVAEGLLKKVISLSPNDFRSYADFGRFLGTVARFPEAIEALEKAIALEPDNVRVHHALGDYLAISGRSADALASYDRALHLDPDYTPAQVGRGHTLKILGRKGDAIESYEKAIAVSPEFGDAWWSLASLRSYEFSDDQVSLLRGQLAAARDDSISGISMYFALARADEAAGDFDSAWLNYRRGNQSKRKQVNYDPIQSEEAHDRIIDFFDPTILEQEREPQPDGPAPIFIVGMPRSGSTLLEQILASHSQVEGTSELPYIGAMTGAISGLQSGTQKYPDGLADMTPDQLSSLGKSYIYRARKRLPEGLPRFTDKMPANFSHVGFIHLMLPNAKIIDARRHPLDTCIGNYRQLFGKGKNYAYDINECGEYYVDYVRVMDHWDEVLPGRVLKVQYEHVISDLESEARRMLDFCELPWEDACLDYHQSDRPVNSASAEQVREPIYNDAVGYWKNYESRLDALKEVLAPVLTASGGT
jgi:tetratricopeptide (TPR) repeat protein